MGDWKMQITKLRILFLFGYSYLSAPLLGVIACDSIYKYLPLWLRTIMPIYVFFVLGLVGIFVVGFVGYKMGFYNIEQSFAMKNNDEFQKRIEEVKQK